MMDTRQLFRLVLAVLLLSAAILHSLALSPNGTNVCSQQCQRTFKERVQSYKRCGLFGWRRCAHYTYQVVVHNETCYECCPGWLQSDNDNCNTQEPCPTGTSGIRSCMDLPDGNYQSCDQCHMYSACSAGHLVENQPCCCGLVWDDELKRCEWKSKTCTQVVNREVRPEDVTLPLTVTSQEEHATTLDPDGINCGSQTRCWVRYNFRYDDNWNDCHGERYVRRSGHPFAKYVGVILCTEERYKLFLGDHLRGIFQNIADGNGDCRDHCEFVGGKQCEKGVHVSPRFWESPLVYGFYRDEWGDEPRYGSIGQGWFPGTQKKGPRTDTGRYYVRWYECNVHIPGNDTVIDYVITSPTMLQTEKEVTTPHQVFTTSQPNTLQDSTSKSTTSQARITSSMSTSSQEKTYTYAYTTERIKTTDTTIPSSEEPQHQIEVDRGSASGNGMGSGTGSTGLTCDIISCPPPSVCVDLYGDDEDEPFSKCVCPPGMTTLHTDPRVCVEVDECESAPCQHGGQCLDRRGGYVCDCAPGWEGNHCQYLQFTESQRPLCNHCVDYGRLAGSCSGRYCECRKGRYNTFTCLPEVSDCIVLRNQSNARGRPELMIDRPVGVVYSCVPGDNTNPIHQDTPSSAKNQQPTYEVHALAIYRSTKGSVVVNVSWPEGEEEESNIILNYQSYVTLALSNYWPTAWTVVIPAWRQLTEVIVFSHAHRNTTVTVRRGSANGGLVPVNTFHLHPASYPPGFGDDTHADTNTPSMLEYLVNQYGSLSSFTGTYQADSWQLKVGQPKASS